MPPVSPAEPPVTQKFFPIRSSCQLLGLLGWTHTGHVLKRLTCWGLCSAKGTTLEESHSHARSGARECRTRQQQPHKMGCLHTRDFGMLNGHHGDLQSSRTVHLHLQ
ncbi:uncharacterized protein [Macaca nemestrina]|uniref:uncharacterized protein isoform X6 n=1 Tax=Macaca nemestrina TaxID=9545 RepID=UPI0039B962A9